jgi:hypothetical protein
MNTLKDDVTKIMEEHGQNYDDGVYGFMLDLSHGGCASGLVGELVYYEDTIAFYQNHKEDINALLVETLEETGMTVPADLFGEKWDKSDPLAMDTQNQNLLAWFAFEETADALAYGR